MAKITVDITDDIPRSLRDIVDKLGSIEEVIDALEVVQENLKNKLKTKGQDTYLGHKYKTKIFEVVCERLDSAAVKAKMGLPWWKSFCRESREIRAITTLLGAKDVKKKGDA